jgi:hypothetical protein
MGGSWLGHVRAAPRCLSALAIVKKPGSGARGRAFRIEIRGATLAPRRRFPFPPVPLLPAGIPALPSQLPLRLCPRYGRGLCAFIRRAGVIVPPGEPPDRTSPAARLRLPRGGGAGPSPRNHRHDRCSRWEELTGIMDQGREAWRKGDEEKCEMPEIGGLRRQARAVLSTLSALDTLCGVISGRPQAGEKPRIWVFRRPGGPGLFASAAWNPG